MRLSIYCFLFFVVSSSLLAQSDPPELSSWVRNTTGLTGYNNLPANVQQVRYSVSNVYVNSSDIPAYSIGPWGSDPNIPTNQNFLLRFSRTPVVNNGTKTATSLGPIGLWANGVVLFNSLDAMSYNLRNIWHQNAVVVEAGTFDACLGHPAPGGVYHHHQNPRCLYSADSTQHSPLLGYAFDGFPIYGPYGFANANGSGGIQRMRSGYRTRSITQRTTLPDGTVLAVSQYGPDVSTQYPLGYYAEDYEYVVGLGDLDAYNGRIVVTPEYPGGTYAYYVTIAGDGSSAYPYTIGPQYYGVVATDDISSHGHVTIGESVTPYNPITPSVPILLLPANGVNLSFSPVNFQWSSSSNSTSYRIQVAIDSQFISTVIDDSTLTDTSTTISSLTAGSTYYWRVKAKNVLRTSAWSSIWHFSIDVPAKWYMVSLPRNAIDASAPALFPNLVSNAYRYDAGLGYVKEDTLRNGTGYWVKLTGDYTPVAVGDTILFDTLAVSSGWNLVGSITNPVTVSSITSSSLGMITSDFFGYNGSYAKKDTIVPGYAYWVKTNQSGILILSSNPTAFPINEISIVATDELPPLPPENANPYSTTRIPHQFFLYQNYPNPFNPTTTFRYQLPASGYVSLTIYSLLGDQVVELIHEEQGSGEHSIQWEANNLPSGVYMCRLQSGAIRETRKVVLLR